MKLTRRIAGLVLASAAAIALASPASAQSTSQALSTESVIESIKEDGVITIGLSLFTPWSMRDLNGELIGFELDVGRKLAADMGVEVEFVPTAWDGIIPALVARKFDVIISGMSITAQRNLTVAFSAPYAFGEQTLLANTAMTEGFTKEDYNNPDVILAVRRGTTSAVTIEKAFPNATLLQFDEQSAVTQEVLNGNAHALMTSEPVPSETVRRYPDTVNIPFEESFMSEGTAFAFRKGDPDAENFFNNWIGLNTRTGWLQERHNYWFTGDEWHDMVPE